MLILMLIVTQNDLHGNNNEFGVKEVNLILSVILIFRENDVHDSSLQYVRKGDISKIRKEVRNKI